MREAEQSLNASCKPLLICFSHLRWNFVWQRPQQILSRATEYYDIVFIEEAERGRYERPLLATSEPSPGVQVMRPCLPEHFSDEKGLEAQQALLRGFARDAPPPAVLWFYSPAAIALNDEFDADVVVYDNMDELSLFRGADRALIEFEAALLARADLVFTGGFSLYEAKRTRHPRAHCLPSSVDVAHFASAREQSGSEPLDHAGVPHPRIGYFGVIDERIDLDLLRDAAALRPDWSFCMIGPIAKIDPASLPRGPNIHWLGQKTYDELPAYLRGWRVGLMPFALNEATRFISPTKTPEFLAGGVPVVSTAIADVVRAYGADGLVEIAADAQSLVDKIEALMLRPKDKWLCAVDARLADESWDQTWSMMHKLIMKVARTQSVGRSIELTAERPNV